MDRINGLSDDIICYILSFLAIKESALTSVLSKRWRYLFVLRPNLHLDDVDFGSGESFTDFVDRVLAVSGNFPLRDFSVRCGKSIDSGHVTGWMYEVLKRGIVKLDIDVTRHEEAILVPLEMFTCNTMVELKLGQGIDAMIPEHVYLPSLKTLSLDSIYFFNTQYCVLGKLLSSCPVLEELTIRSGSWQNGNCCRTLSSSSLKKLTMKCPEGSSHFWDMTLDTPSLAYLDYSDIVPIDYPIVNLESLVEAKLDLCLFRGTSNPTNLIKGLRNVQVLELSSDTSRMFYHCCEAIPLLSSLSHLSIAIDFVYDWKYLPMLIRKSPNLQTLVIKGPLHADRNEEKYELPCPVKVLKISEYGGKIGELRRMKHLLEKLSCLELVEVCACATSEKEKFRITKYLLMLPRSSKCKIEIKFSE